MFGPTRTPGSSGEQAPSQQTAQTTSGLVSPDHDRAKQSPQTTTTFPQPTQPTSQPFGQPTTLTLPVDSKADATHQKLASGFFSYTPAPASKTSPRTGFDSGPKTSFSLTFPSTPRHPSKAFGGKVPPFGKSYEGPGSAFFVFTPTAERDLLTGDVNFFQSVTRMPHFMDLSFEELRLQDYCQNRISHKDQTNFFGCPTTQSPFSSGQTTTQSPFSSGQTTTQPPFSSGQTTTQPPFSSGQTTSPFASVQQNQKSPFKLTVSPNNNLLAKQSTEPTNKVTKTTSSEHSSDVVSQPPPAQATQSDLQKLQKEMEYEIQGLQLEQAQQKLRQLQMEIQIQDLLQQCKQQPSTAGIGTVPVHACSCGGYISRLHTPSTDLTATYASDVKEKSTLDPSSSVSGGLFRAPYSPQQELDNFKDFDSGYTLLNDSYFKKKKRPASLHQYQYQYRQSTDSIIELETRDHASASDIEMAVRDGYYCSPPLDILKRLTPRQLEQVGGFMVGRYGYGKVEFTQPVDLSKVPLDMILSSLVRFGYKTVTIYPDIKNKPHRGQGLNVPAKVTLEQCYTLDKTTHSRVMDPSHPRFARFLAKLKSRPGTIFVDYDIVNGAWAFLVDSF
ncbi:hypothetical protein [Absidia glauca]|uniref:Peptidase S59 domain-containing protein n=1 Tax=Absidia glauca TaxID=4829 RepID=A0A163M8M9_ABSGL|nr:hypothetical protein [Absidia glauca]